MTSLAVAVSETSSANLTLEKLKLVVYGPQVHLQIVFTQSEIFPAYRTVFSAARLMWS